ncbi:MAG: HAD-IA family hydrolase [Verrucomicrobiaceae bacterium]|nr:HAD-IA family hydrolase [Verrucomicrobiaceae bacterium]
MFIKNNLIDTPPPYGFCRNLALGHFSGGEIRIIGIEVRPWIDFRMKDCPSRSKIADHSLMEDLIKVVFFDAVGTLIRLKEPVGSTYSAVALQYGIDLPPEHLEAAFRSEWARCPAPFHEGSAPDDDREWWRDLVNRVFETAGIVGGVGSDLFDDLYDHFARPDTWEVFPDVRPALERLAVRCRLFVLSNFDRRLRRILGGHGLDSCFDGMIISSEVGVSKPHPRIFDVALRAARIPPGSCLHVGDELKADGDGAREAGMRFFHVRRPEHGLDRILL